MQMIVKICHNQKGFYLITFILDLPSKTFTFRTYVENGTNSRKVKIDMLLLNIISIINIEYYNIVITVSCNWSRICKYGTMISDTNQFHIASIYFNSKISKYGLYINLLHVGRAKLYLHILYKIYDFGQRRNLKLLYI